MINREGHHASSASRTSRAVVLRQPGHCLSPLLTGPKTGSHSGFPSRLRSPKESVRGCICQGTWVKKTGSATFCLLSRTSRPPETVVCPWR